jgi:hypothetical protein
MKSPATMDLKIFYNFTKLESLTLSSAGINNFSLSNQRFSLLTNLKHLDTSKISLFHSSSLIGKDNLSLLVNLEILKLGFSSRANNDRKDGKGIQYFSNGDREKVFSILILVERYEGE